MLTQLQYIYFFNLKRGLLIFTNCKVKTFFLNIDFYFQINTGQNVKACIYQLHSYTTQQVPPFKNLKMEKKKN